MKKLVGTFSEAEVKNGNDKKAVEQMQNESGLKYVITKQVKVKGVPHLRIWLTDNFEIAV